MNDHCVLDYAHQPPVFRCLGCADIHRSEGGLLHRADGSVVPCRTESEIFNQIGLRWVHPWDREIR